MKKFFALLLSIMLLSTAALAEVKIGQVEYAAHGTSCFAVLTVAMDGDTIVPAHLDEFQFMDAFRTPTLPSVRTIPKARCWLLRLLTTVCTAPT